MTRYNIFRILISSSAILAAIGCGDPSVDDRSILGGPATIDPSESVTVTSSEEEVELACESACDAMRECAGIRVTVDCVESCVTSYAAGIETGDECALAGIDLLNCYSSLGCPSLPFDDEGACADAARAVHATCGGGDLRVVDDPESDRELVAEIHDGSWSDLDADTEETSPTDGSEDEEPDVTDVTEPIVIVEIPGEVVIVDFRRY
ncbi:MAG: hypothetical protein WBM46_12105 [Polyangiales bacterium]